MTSEDVWKTRHLLNWLRRLGVIGELQLAITLSNEVDSYDLRVIGYNPAMKGKLTVSEQLDERFKDLINRG